MSGYEIPRQQLCITCHKATGGCRWSDELKPVHGWTATPTKVYTNGASMDSYKITACPEYEADKPLTDLHDDGVFNLLQIHIAKSVQEYIWAVQRYEKYCEIFGSKSERALDAKKTVTMYEKFVLPESIAQTALRKWRNGEYDPDEFHKRTRLSKGD